MKFTLPIFTLLAATSALSFRLENQFVKREDYGDKLSSLTNSDNNTNDISKIKNEIENNEELKNKIKHEFEKVSNSTVVSAGSSFNDTNTNVSANGFEGLASDFGDITEKFNSTDSDSSGFKKCQEVVNRYHACLPKELTEENYDESCTTFNSEQCQALFKEKVASNASCKNVSDQFQHNVDYITGIMNINCAKDEKGQYCPISNFSKTAKSDDVLADEIIRQSCQSKNCREKAIEGINAMKNMTETILTFSDDLVKINKMKREFHGIERANEMLAILNEEKCAQQANTIASNSIPSIQMSYSMVLTIVSLILLLF